MASSYLNVLMACLTSPNMMLAPSFLKFKFTGQHTNLVAGEDKKEGLQDLSASLISFTNPFRLHP